MRTSDLRTNPEAYGVTTDAMPVHKSQSIDDIVGSLPDNRVHEKIQGRDIVELLDIQCCTGPNAPLMGGQTCLEQGFPAENRCIYCVAASEIEELRDEIEMLRDELHLHQPVCSLELLEDDSEPWEDIPRFVTDPSGEHACLCLDCGSLASLNEAEDGFVCPNCGWEYPKRTPSLT